MDEAEALLELLGAYSPSGEEAKAVEVFVRLAKALGYAAERDGAGNGIARRGSGAPQTLYLGHIDTVDGDRPARRVGGRLYGRGACDAKGPLAAALVAGANAPTRGEIVIAACVGEEADSRGARFLLDRWRPAYVIAGEPSGWDGIVYGYKGDLELKATFEGARTHLSSPTPSTTERALAWIAAVKAEASKGGGATPFQSITSKVASVRTVKDGGRERVEVLLDLRFPPGASVAGFAARLSTTGEPAEIARTAEIEPFAGRRDDPVVAALSAAIRAEGGRPTYWRRGGTSDLNLVAPAWRTGGAAYGPGDSHLDHTDDEYVEEADLARARRILERAFEALSGRPTAPTTSPSAPSGA